MQAQTNLTKCTFAEYLSNFVKFDSSLRHLIEFGETVWDYLSQEVNLLRPGTKWPIAFNRIIKLVIWLFLNHEGLLLLLLKLEALHLYWSRILRCCPHGSRVEHLHTSVSILAPNHWVCTCNLVRGWLVALILLLTSLMHNLTRESFLFLHVLILLRNLVKNTLRHLTCSLDWRHSITWNVSSQALLFTGHIRVEEDLALGLLRMLLLLNI